MCRWMFILFCVIGNANFLRSQCPGKDVLFKRLIAIQKSESIKPADKLSELLRYDTIVNACAYADDSLYVWLLTNIGAQYYRQNDFYRAIQYSNKALQVIRSNLLKPSINEKHAIRLYYYLTIYYDSLNLASKKNEAIDSCIANEKRLGSDYHYTCVLLAFRVADLFFKGDYSLCVEYSALGELLVREYYHESDSMDYINFFIEQKTLALSASKKFVEAETFLNSKKAHYSNTRNNAYLGVFNYLLAQIYMAKEEDEKAIQYLLKAFEYSSKTPEKEISGEILGIIGIIYNERLKQPAIALQYYQKALRYARPLDALIAFVKIGNVYAEKKDFDSAFYFFQKAFDRIKPGINENDLLKHTQEYVDVGTSDYIMDVVLTKADTYIEKYRVKKNKTDLLEALRIYKVADRLLNRIKDEQIAVESKLVWRKYARQLYEHAIEASWLTNHIGDAFYFFEKSRAVLLNDQLNEQKWLSGSEMIRLAQLKKKIRESEKESAGTNPASAQAAAIRQQQFTYNQEMARLGQWIKEHNPLYFRSVIDTSFTGVFEMQKKLSGSKQSLIELFAGDSAVYILAITPQLIKLKKLNKTTYDNIAAQFIGYTADARLLNKNFAKFVSLSNQLYDLIFKDCNISPGRIIISPDGKYLPFESLVTSKPGEPVTFFLEDYAVSYTYSARFLLNDFYSDSVNAAKSFLGVAPVSYPSSFSLASLAGSEKSLNAISANFSGAANLISSAASRNSFLKQFSQYKIIQLYTHASDSSKNNEPVIYFADSILYLSDLTGETKPMTKLIVLSACETGLGKEYKGEGIFSFNRGFAAMGIPSSVTNLWTIDNESTYKITELFYKYIADGAPLDEALQKAKLEFIKTSSKEKQLPYYWAAPVLVGNTDAIPAQKNRNGPLYAVAIGVPVLFFIFFVAKRKRRESIPTPGRAETVS